MSSREQVHQKAIEILEKRKRGLRFTRLVNEIHKKLPDTSERTISTYVQMLEQHYPKDVYRPARGLFRHTSFKEEAKHEKITKPKVRYEEHEKQFYQGFADYLVGDLEESTEARPLGEKTFKDKWGTPDVIGVQKPKPDDPVKYDPIVVSAEVKFGKSTTELITAFGQTCAYKAFSHKAYLVIPKDSAEEDISRIQSLCMIFGIGLVLFDSTSPDDPKFEIKTRALKTEPDYFYLNRNAKEIVDTRLFG